ncbi:MAG: CDP-alcohol phosphatidyltransferase family protein [Planctomycetota bacterium]
MPGPTNDYQPLDRRPIRARRWPVIHTLTDTLVRLGVSANAVSITGLLFGVIAGVALALTPFTNPDTPLLTRALWLAAAALIQARALCNLLDGMVAVERGTASPTGELFNEVPDRLSDTAMLGGLGLSLHATPWLGLTAALAAVLVAYVRAQAAAAGAGQDYAGPMAKPVRMQLVAALCGFLALAPTAWTNPFAISLPDAILAFITLGCVVTLARRLRRAARRLQDGAPSE